MREINIEEKYQLSGEPPLDDQAKRYLGFLLEGKRRQAQELIMDVLSEGGSLQEIYLNIFQSTQREIGFLWETNQIMVAEEHYCTASTQMIMAQLYPQILDGEKKDRAVVIACVGGELHEMGARMVADFFEMDGWETYFIGANTPTDSVIKTIQKRQPDLVGFSVTMTSFLPELKELLERIHREIKLGQRDIKIIVGGRPFIVAPELWKKLDDVDGYAEDVLGAIELANTLVKEA